MFRRHRQVMCARQAVGSHAFVGSVITRYVRGALWLGRVRRLWAAWIRTCAFVVGWEMIVFQLARRQTRDMLELTHSKGQN